MATLVLGAAGAALGGVVGGSVAGLAAPVIGRALGATAGAVLDQRLLGRGSVAVETGRVAALRLQGSMQGTPLPRVFGRMRVTGTVIWASRFRDHVETRREGGKGTAPRATTVRQHSYSVSLALALCEGPVDRIGRIWADGVEIAADSLSMRLHRGTEDATPDPLIVALEGAARAPAFRGTAYLVFEDLPLANWGNRVPQFAVEVVREPRLPVGGSTEIAPPLTDLVEAVALIPGTGEFALDTDPVLRRLSPGQTLWENINGLATRPDLLRAIDQLEEALPACRSVLLVVSWFGDDLRAAHCQLYPAVEDADKATEPHTWSVSGISRGSARIVGRMAEGRPVYGGTPADRSVIACIRELKARGYRVVFYPFVLMDIPPDNARPDPYGGARQPAHPWRGRITLTTAPGLAGSPDQTAAAETEVATFVGQARPWDFERTRDGVRFRGAPEWSFRRMVLHYAHLCAAAGGVDAFCIGSELRGLTQVRSSPTAFPFVTALKSLAHDVRQVVGPTTKLSYAADWSEYFGYRPNDGSRDVLFHLDPLWSDPEIDFVGIDNYMPVADWRDGLDHLDSVEAGTGYSLGYLRANIEGGEGFDWYYASEADRRAQRRTAIADTAHGEDWVFRYKDLRSWWSLPHHDRPGGDRLAEPTGWVPGSKPIWFTELGCPAVAQGPNQPNVFVDPKSAESALPHFSTGAADAYAQRRYLQAVLGYWSNPANIPVSPQTGQPMLDSAQMHVWTWDARPWPDFPRRTDVWSDGAHHRVGHWLTGRIGAAGLAETVAEICASAGVVDVDVSRLHGLIEGYRVDAVQSARAALQPLMLAFGFDVVESAGVLRFLPRGNAPVARLELGSMVSAREGANPVLTRAAADESPARLRLLHLDSASDYSVVSCESHDGAAVRVDTVELPLALEPDGAQAILQRWQTEVMAARDTAAFALPPDRLALEPGDIVSLGLPEGNADYRIDRVTLRAALEIEATRVLPIPVAMPASTSAALLPPSAPTPPVAILLDLPSLGDAAPAPSLRLAVHARPWMGPMAVFAAQGDDGYRLIGEASACAVFGTLGAPLAPASPARWWRGVMTVDLWSGRLDEATTEAVLNGANLAALEAEPGRWEIVQFAQAALAAPGRWQLRTLLRGQAGTEALARRTIPAGARFVLLDGGLGDVALTPAMLGQPRHYRIGPQHLGYDDPAYTHLVATADGIGLRPFAPVHGRVERRGGDCLITWTRRSRLDADRWTADEPPLGEDRERYRVRLVAGTRLMREAITETAFFSYTAADRAADAPDGPVIAQVAQLSSAVGAGPELEIAIDG